MVAKRYQASGFCQAPMKTVISATNPLKPGKPNEHKPAMTKTDSKGQYQFKGLAVGAYAITTIVKEVPKSRASVRTRADGWAKVDFDLRLKAGDASIKRNYVWVKGEPGSHIGGRWVPVDQAGKPGMSAVDTVGSDDVERMQRDTKLNTTTAMPGR